VERCSRGGWKKQRDWLAPTLALPELVLALLVEMQVLQMLTVVPVLVLKLAAGMEPVLVLVLMQVLLLPLGLWLLVWQALVLLVLVPLV
jgi:hypothetical protein